MCSFHLLHRGSTLPQMKYTVLCCILGTTNRVKENIRIHIPKVFVETLDICVIAGAKECYYRSLLVIDIDQRFPASIENHSRDSTSCGLKWATCSQQQSNQCQANHLW
jgi:hypothetical protein